MNLVGGVLSAWLALSPWAVFAQPEGGTGGLGAAYDELVEGMKPRTPVLRYADVEKAFKGLVERPEPADLVARGGVWLLELNAAPWGVVFSEGGFDRRRKTGVEKARLIFTQEIASNDNPYVDRTASFKASERALHVCKSRGLWGDPPAVVLDVADPARFSTYLEDGWRYDARKAYECRRKDQDRILCKVEVSERNILKEPAYTLYLGFARAK